MIDLGQWVNVVRCGIAVYHLELLTYVQGDYVRLVLAALLSDGVWLRRYLRCGGCVQSLGDINHYILQTVVRAYYDGFGGYGTIGMDLGARRFLGHVNLLLFWRGPIQLGSSCDLPSTGSTHGVD